MREKKNDKENNKTQNDVKRNDRQKKLYMYGALKKTTKQTLWNALGTKITVLEKDKENNKTDNSVMM